MVFSSHLFIFYFLPVVLPVYYASPSKVRHLGLTLFSYLFYGWANPWFVLLMLGTTAVDYTVGLWIAGAFGRNEVPLLPTRGPRTRSQKLALAVSVVSNLSLLGFFKYFNFGLDNYNFLMTALGLSSWHWDTALRVTLPLGISFYTFQSMSYTIDVYRGDARAVRSFIDFACFVTMFPQLVAGPIIRFSDVADQLQSRTHTVEKFARGVALFSLGLSKKVLIANPCGKTSLYERLPRPVRVALTFALVNLGCVFFRSDDLPSALAFVGSLFGVGAAHAGTALIGGLLYTPYYLGSFVLAAVVVWLAPQSCDWTRRLSWRRALICVVLLWAGLSVMLTQAYDPFIYFIF